MRTILFLIFFISPFFNLSAQEQVLTDSTTIIFVRHAEKLDDGTANPKLSEVGLKRAHQLKELLTESYDVDVIFSTEYHRTTQTASPLAETLNKEIYTYGFSDPVGFLKELLTDYPSQTVVIVGHSNTTAFLANLLMGDEIFEPIEEEDYSNIYVIKATDIGKTGAKHITY